jgi:DNA-binding PadR family transcriptional regulator
VDTGTLPNHKLLLLLGLLRDGPRHGYELNRIVRAHGALYADLGRANIYYLLDQMAAKGLASATPEAGAPGNRGLRLKYRLTASGHRHFGELLRAEMLTFNPPHTGVDVAVVLLTALPEHEAIILLRERQTIVAARRSEIAAELAQVSRQGIYARIAADHLLSLIEAELNWIERSLRALSADDGSGGTSVHDG